MQISFKENSLTGHDSIDKLPLLYECPRGKHKKLKKVKKNIKSRLTADVFQL
jgi:hypothetical protein